MLDIKADDIIETYVVDNVHPSSAWAEDSLQPTKASILTHGWLKLGATCKTHNANIRPWEKLLWINITMPHWSSKQIHTRLPLHKLMNI